MVTFMVVNGFSLFTLKKLYIDELYDYLDSLAYNLYKSGKIKKESYDKINKGNETTEDTVNMLRDQLFKSIANKNKK